MGVLGTRVMCTYLYIKVDKPKLSLPQNLMENFCTNRHKLHVNNSIFYHFGTVA